MRWISDAKRRQHSVAACIPLLAAAAVFAQQPSGRPVVAPQPVTGTNAALNAIPPAFATSATYRVVLDPAHGGADVGAELQAGLDEKSFTLTLAQAVAAELRAHSIPVTLTRTTDVAIAGSARAQAMNLQHASACISLHATASGSGVHLYTSEQVQSATPDGQRNFVPWRAEQAGYIERSLRLESEVNSELTRAHIPVLLGRATLMPLESAGCPALAVEVAPLNDGTALSDAKYQQQVADALTAALIDWSADWKVQP